MLLRPIHASFGMGGHAVISCPCQSRGDAQDESIPVPLFKSLYEEKERKETNPVSIICK